MANTKKVTEASVTAESNVAVAKAEQQRKAAVRKFKDQKKVSVSIPPLYKPYFGRVMTVTMQGATVAIPCDGKHYLVPASFAEEIMIRMDNQNELLEKQAKMGDVQNNFEASPGELNLF